MEWIIWQWRYLLPCRNFPLVSRDLGTVSATVLVAFSKILEGRTHASQHRVAPQQVGTLHRDLPFCLVWQEFSAARSCQNFDLKHQLPLISNTLVYMIGVSPCLKNSFWFPPYSAIHHRRCRLSLGKKSDSSRMTFTELDLCSLSLGRLMISRPDLFCWQSYRQSSESFSTSLLLLRSYYPSTMGISAYLIHSASR